MAVWRTALSSQSPTVTLVNFVTVAIRMMAFDGHSAAIFIQWFIRCPRLCVEFSYKREAVYQTQGWIRWWWRECAQEGWDRREILVLGKRFHGRKEGPEVSRVVGLTKPAGERQLECCDTKWKAEV